MGISETAIRALSEDGDEGSLRYYCTKCRIEGRSDGDSRAGSSGESVAQLFEIVRRLSTSVESLAQQMTGIVQRLNNPLTSQQTQHHDLKGMIREELTEMNEREKRKQSLIL